MKKGEKTKHELLKIAYRMFLSKGYENTSIDEIIEEAKIAKGTYYYHFKSKEQMLEEVIQLMIDEYEMRANEILNSDLDLPEKMIGIITSFRPNNDEFQIVETLNRQDNLIMHNKINRQVIERVVPMLSKIVEEGVQLGILKCKNIPQRIRIIMILSSELFDDMEYSNTDVDVFIDIVEKILGAQPGFLIFLNKLIQKQEDI